MKFKIDENLPVELAELLMAAGHDASTVITQGLQGSDDPAVIAVCRHEQRVLVTLDLDFVDIRAYPPEDFSGLIVMRVARQDKNHLIHVFRPVIPLLGKEPLDHRLWIVEEARVRIRGREDWASDSLAAAFVQIGVLPANGIKCSRVS